MGPASINNTVTERERAVLVVNALNVPPAEPAQPWFVSRLTIAILAESVRDSEPTYASPDDDEVVSW